MSVSMVYQWEFYVLKDTEKHSFVPEYLMVQGIV